MNSLSWSKGLTAITLAAVTAVAGGPAWSADWNHDPASLIGPPHWGELDPTFTTCGTGMQQSPIDIRTAEVEFAGGQPRLQFRYDEVPLVVENNGHAIEVPIESGNELRIGGERYRLLQVHFHTPSEHTVDGASFAMEAHLVHINSSGQLAVVGVLMVLGDPSPAVAAVFDNAPPALGEVHVEGVEFHPEDLLPESGSYYAYPGSLTTPPCSEGVRWFVLREPVSVSARQVRQLADFVRDFPGYDGYDQNNRPVLPLNERVVTQPRPRD